MSIDPFRILQREQERALKMHGEDNSDYTEGYLDGIDYAIYIMSTPEE